MRYAQIRPMDISNGEGIGVALFVQGCPIHCKGCFQPETGSFDSGELFTGIQEQQIYQLLKEPHITRFSLLGGEPLIPQNLDQLNYMLCTIKSNGPDKKIGVWTGYTWGQLQEKRKEVYPDKYFVLFKYIDYLIAGPFVEEEKDLTLLGRGSRNQEVIDMKQTLATGKKVTYV